MSTSMNEYDFFHDSVVFIDYILKKLYQGNVLHPFIPVW